MRSGLFRDYGEALGALKWRAWFLAGVLGFSGMLEGLALTAIVPLLGSQLGGEQDNFAVGNFSVSGDDLSRLALLALVALGLLSAAVKLMGELGISRIRGRVEESMRLEMTDRLLDMGWVPFLSLRLGDISKSIVLEGNQTGVGAESLIHGIGSLLTVAALMVIAAFVSPGMLAFAVAFGVLAYLAYQLIARRASRYQKRLSRESSRISQEVSDVFGSLKFVRSTGNTEAARRRAHDLFRSYKQTYIYSHAYGILSRFAFEVIGVLFLGAILGMAVLAGGTPSARSLAFIALFYRMAPRIQNVQRHLHHAQTYISWFGTWRDRMQAALEGEQKHAGTKAPQFRRAIELRQVEVRFPGASANALDGVDVTLVRPKEFVGIVGESGSGKTTMLDLVTGLLSPTAGEVLLDDVSLEDIDLAAWQRRIGLVMQDSPLFYGSVLENIALGDPHPDRDLAYECARLANARSFVERMPDGLETVVGERGGRLSGGQRQRLALARALYRQPWLLVLDEPTSALDSASEETVLDAIGNIRQQCAIVLVAHRLRTVMDADRILAVQEGRIAEEGSWAELMSRPAGLVKDMARAQGVKDPQRR